LELGYLVCLLGFGGGYRIMLLLPGADRLGEPPGRHLPRFGMGADPVVEVDVSVMLTTSAGEEPHFARVIGVRVVGTRSLWAGACEVEGQQAA
jgi:hypothetical protein